MTDQKTSEDIQAIKRGNSPEYAAARIEEWRQAGALNELLGVKQHAAAAEQLTQADVQAMYRERRYDEITAAREAGRCNDLLGIITDREV